MVFPSHIFQSLHLSVISSHFKRVISKLFSGKLPFGLFLKSKPIQSHHACNLQFRSSSKTLLAGLTAAVFLKPEEKHGATLVEETPTDSIDGSRLFSSSSVDRPDRKRYCIEKGKYKVIFVLGGPGVGKGTQCSKMAQEFGWVHVSAGDLLRREQAREKSPFVELIATCIREGNIVPHFVTIALLKAEMELYPHGTIFLIDGFPREVGQAEAFERTVIPMDLVLFFECEEETMLSRLMHRSQTSGRTDDNIDSILKRFRTYQQSSIPVISYYEEKGKVKRVGIYF
ncbi:hypothetical protein DI09_28p150 [Mitosporidium daphniae]|uniref:Adenylate kinase n=1 Tax=Mitosporidium daphniae TaxID=1485682 RepID=A0A098VSD7_9MICR|nr:uncharacterized protein DI09_28p150 [Mitosporidium daphniae]KGG51734.1 hypothetical protein DI09_28p150 [Mitosporidium daphniae]|eukprot:XP_013238162.1 uncharacterized protein DI09_28p150 [Mitosporidium daphniae]